MKPKPLTRENTIRPMGYVDWLIPETEVLSAVEGLRQDMDSKYYHVIIDKWFPVAKKRGGESE